MKFTATQEQDGKRLDQVLKEHIRDISRSRIKKLIQTGACALDGDTNLKPDTRIYAFQTIDLELPQTENKLEAEQGDVEILYEDDDLAICDKPPFLAVHPCPSRAGNTLVQRLLNRYPQLTDQEGQRPGIVHRLDMDTSGLIMVALNEKTRLKLSEDFSERKVRKEYLALVAGVTPTTGQCYKPLGRHPRIKTKMAIVSEREGGKEAATEWRRLWHNDKISLLAVRIFTGRTHQIRVHLADAGYPVIGDKTYGSKQTASLAPRQMLHAWKLKFTHPSTGQEMSFRALPPDDFIQAAIKNSQGLPKIVITGNPGCGKSTFRKLLEERGIGAISADRIVADLYAGKSPVSDWLAMHGLEDLLEPDSSVNKQELFAFLGQKTKLQKEFENFVHELVKDSIEEFWRSSPCSALAAAAEVPLYFECGWQKIFRPAPLVLGVHCPYELRAQRIKNNRGWAETKIATMESWQLPEKEKMGLCDVVINNAGDEANLALEADKFIESLEKAKIRAEKGLVEKLNSIFLE